MKTRRDFLKMTALGLFAPAGSAFSKTTTQKPNILLIVSEDNGPHLSCYGDKNVKTINLDQLAKEGVRFENAFVPYSVCSPSRAAFLTGLYPHQNGQIGLATHKYAMFKKFPNISTILKKNGYTTGLIGKLHVNPESAFDFDYRWNDSKFISFNHRDIKKIAEKAGEFISSSQKPFFLSVNYPDTHFPLIEQYKGYPQKPLKTGQAKPFSWVGVDTEHIRQYTANYYNCMMRLDSGIGMLLKELERSGKADNTMIIYLGDHGPQFSRGKTSVYEAALRIPLIIRYPGKTKTGISPNELVSTIDILPTILKATGLPEMKELPGLALQPLMKEEKCTWRKYIYAQTNGSAPVLYYQQFSIRDERYKLIINPLRDRDNTCAAAYLNHHNVFFKAGCTQDEIDASSKKIKTAYQTYLKPPLYELYDLKNDPDEFHNLADNAEYQQIRKRLLKEFERFQVQTKDMLSKPSNLQKLTAEHDRLVNYNYRGDKEFKWEYLKYLNPDGQ